MLKWEKDINGYNGQWIGGYIGFEDDCPKYRVSKDEDGWYWEDSWGFSYGGFDTDEQAKAEAEKDCEAHDLDVDWEDLEPLDLEDIEDAYWDEVAHERMKTAKGLSW